MIKTIVRVVPVSTFPWGRKRRVFFDDGTTALATRREVVDSIFDAYALHRPVQVFFDRRGRIVGVRELTGAN